MMRVKEGEDACPMCDMVICWREKRIRLECVEGVEC